MALNPDDYFGDAAVKPAAPEAKPRYAPAPTTAEGADERLAEVQSAEEEIRAWAEGKRKKKAGGAPPATAPAAAPATAAERKPLNPDDYFEADPPPPPPKKPGMLARAGEFLAAGRSKPYPSLAGITKEQAAGMLPEEAAAAPQPVPGQPDQQTLARQPWEADVRPVTERRRARFAENDPRRVDQEFSPAKGGSILDRPEALNPAALQDMQGRTASDQAAGSMSPERGARAQADAQAEYKGRRPYAEAKPLELTNEISTAIREATKNPAARGVVSGLSELGKVGTARPSAAPER
jgi:hypothetical protein